MEEKELYEKAKKKVEEIKSFYTHLIVYVVVNIAFYILVGKGWLWVTFFWGIGILTHGLKTIGFTEEWEERKIRELVEREKKKMKKVEKDVNKKEEETN